MSEPCTYPQAAETSRKAMEGMAVEVAKMLDQTDINPRDAAFAIAEGALAYAINGYLAYGDTFKIPTHEVRRIVDEAFDRHWKQAVAALLTHKAKIKIANKGAE
jgi:hypothetical protein